MDTGGTWIKAKHARKGRNSPYQGQEWRYSKLKRKKNWKKVKGDE
jgi:hypothetical protein